MERPRIRPGYANPAPTDSPDVSDRGKQRQAWRQSIGPQFEQIPERRNPAAQQELLSASHVLSGKNSITRTSRTVSEDCTEEWKVHRQRLCALDRSRLVRHSKRLLEDAEDIEIQPKTPDLALYFSPSVNSPGEILSPYLPARPPPLKLVGGSISGVRYPSPMSSGSHDVAVEQVKRGETGFNLGYVDKEDPAHRLSTCMEDETWNFPNTPAAPTFFEDGENPAVAVTPGGANAGKMNLLESPSRIHTWEESSHLPNSGDRRAPDTSQGFMDLGSTLLSLPASFQRKIPSDQSGDPVDRLPPGLTVEARALVQRQQARHRVIPPAPASATESFTTFGYDDSNLTPTVESFGTSIVITSTPATRCKYSYSFAHTTIDAQPDGFNTPIMTDTSRLEGSAIDRATKHVAFVKAAQGPDRRDAYGDETGNGYMASVQKRRGVSCPLSKTALSLSTFHL